jgi:alpha-tubulin suppressor-like RCC1 family protein
MVRTEWFHAGFDAHLSFGARSNEAPIHDPTDIEHERSACLTSIASVQCNDATTNERSPGQGRVKNAFVGWCCLFVLDESGQLCRIKFDSGAVQASSRSHVQLPDSFALRDLDWSPQHSFMLTREGQVRYWIDSDLTGESPIEPFLSDVTSGRSVKAISVGTSFACSLLDDGTVKGVDDEQSEVEFNLGPSDSFESIACGQRHVLLLSKAGRVYSFGDGSKGQLGHGDLTDVWNDCQLIQALDGVCVLQVAAGSWHSIALTEFGDVYCWGTNECGQLGVISSVPTAIATLPTLISASDQLHFVQIACGSRHSMAITDQGHLWAWGWNKYGQCALPTSVESANAPTRVSLPSTGKAVAIKCKYWASLVMIAF